MLWGIILISCQQAPSIRSITKPLSEAVAINNKLAEGDLSVTVDVDRSDEVGQLLAAMKNMVDKLKQIMSDINMLSDAAVHGKLATRADVSKHAGDYQKIVQGINDTLDAVIRPLNVSAEYVDRISKGDIPPKITDEYKGDFNEIKNNLNSCINAVKALVADANALEFAAVEGKLATRADATKHQGDFRKIVEGVNNTLDAVIGPLNVAAEYVDRISKGEIPPKITDEYNGDFNEIKNNLNNCIDGLGGLVECNAVLQEDGRQRSHQEGRRKICGALRIRVRSHEPGEGTVAGDNKDIYQPVHGRYFGPGCVRESRKAQRRGRHPPYGESNACKTSTC